MAGNYFVVATSFVPLRLFSAPDSGGISDGANPRLPEKRALRF